MAWTTVETPNARYVLLFSPDWVKTGHAPEKFDALILESPYVIPENLNISKETITLKLFKEIVSDAAKGGKDVWITDARPKIKPMARMVVGQLAVILSVAKGSHVLLKLPEEKKKISRRKFLAKLFGGLSTLIIPSSIIGPVSSSVFQTKIKHEKSWDVASKAFRLIGGKGVVTLGNALTAEKADSFIAPRLQKQLGRKPVIAMAYGTGHYGIKKLLENPLKRQNILRKHNLEKYLKRPQRAIQIKLDSKGRITETKEFSEALKLRPKKTVKKGPKISRREFFRRAIRRV